MPSLNDILDAIWRKPNRQMAWGRIAPGHVVGAGSPEPFAVDQDYVVVRLGSMFLKNSRVLWLKLSPLAHATVNMVGRTHPTMEAAVIGPAQFGDLAMAPADRLLTLNQRLAGPTVWNGGDLAIALGLFAVPRDEAAVALLNTLSQVASLAMPGMGQGLEVARIVKSGVEGVIGLDKTQPVLAVKDAFADPRTADNDRGAGPCVLVGIGTEQAKVNFDRLWVKDGRLWTGSTAFALKPYEDFDHVLVAIERGAAREDWRGLPSLAAHETAFDKVLRDTGLKREEAEAKLNEVFGEFDGDLTAESGLTGPDKERIRGQVIAEVKMRLDRRGGPFGSTAAASRAETRSVGGIRSEVSIDGFDYLAVGEGGSEAAMPAKAGALPF